MTIQVHKSIHNQTTLIRHNLNSIFFFGFINRTRTIMSKSLECLSALIIHKLERKDFTTHWLTFWLRQTKPSPQISWSNRTEFNFRSNNILFLHKLNFLGVLAFKHFEVNELFLNVNLFLHYIQKDNQTIIQIFKFTYYYSTCFFYKKTYSQTCIFYFTFLCVISWNRFGALVGWFMD